MKKLIIILVIVAVVVGISVAYSNTSKQNVGDNKNINSEGKVNPKVMSLSMKSWEWVSATYEDGGVIKPKAPGVFSIIFKDNGEFTAKTDCNSMGGNYSARGDVMTFSNISSTEMFCEGSQESDFASLLTNTNSYGFTKNGELILGLKFTAGTVLFR